MADYGARVMQDIRKTRPAAFAGTWAVTVGFVIAPSGALAELRVLRSSGRKDLDAIAADLIHRAAPFDPPPAARTDRFSHEFMAK